MVLRVEQKPCTHLPQVAQTLGLARFFACLRKHGEQNRRQNGDNRNHNQQLNQRKALGFSSL
jgi:hypothetical protein